MNEARASLIRQIRGRSISLSHEREKPMGITLANTKTKCPNQGMIDNFYTSGLLGHLNSKGETRDRMKNGAASWVKPVSKDHLIGYMIAHGLEEEGIKALIDWIEYDTDLLDGD